MHTIQILLQTTIPPVDDDWSIGRFSRLTELLRAHRDSEGRPTFNVVARDRGRLGQPDPILSRLDETEFDELWLFAGRLNRRGPRGNYAIPAERSWPVRHQGSHGSGQFAVQLGRGGRHTTFTRAMSIPTNPDA